MQLAPTNTAQTMSTREIAELCEKEHKNVMRDAETMLQELGINGAQFLASFKTSQGNTYACYDFDRELTLTLVSGYSIALRHKIVKRMEELEAKQATEAFKVPQTLSEALLLGAELAKQVETLALENSQKAEVIERLEHKVDESKKWASVKRMEAAHGLHFKYAPLRKLSLAKGYDMPKVADANYPQGVNTYHEEVWMAVYGVEIIPQKGVL